jgi:hypothetical protein
MNRSLMLRALLVGSVIGLGEAIAETALANRRMRPRATRNA